ncbi:acetoacetate--CoA ligase (plasmid) [Leisingera sp. M527]|uniref:acetoacetate--CoA ligase n=1 Tax=Leisingera sp. M527 TaxID=2867014 RepID=UPI0021A58D5F|nr:acetoacetate--CoA ligase [Leisingera sp. M527]UWQ35451.1 acetoacetate--CoA ligase [Leisingera sp. M527]
MNKPLWSPTTEQIENAQITKFTAHANKEWGRDMDSYRDLHDWSVKHSEEFWASLWTFDGVVGDLGPKPWLVDGDKMPGAKFFPGATLNYAECLLKRRDDAPAVIFRGENGKNGEISFAELYDQVSRVAQALKDCGVGSGDRVSGYLPNILETVIAMIATTSLGAIWSSTSSDFGVQGVIDRFAQVEPKVLFFADGYHYNGKAHSVMDKMPGILEALPSVEKIVMVRYMSDDTSAEGLGRGAEDWDSFLSAYEPQPIEFERFPFDHPLFILFSSGTTGKPKCIMHGAGGTLLTHIREHVLHGDGKPLDRVFGFTTCGWMMWNWLISALASEITVILYDGSPFYPKKDVMFDMVDDTKMTVWQVGAKFLDACRKEGLRPVDTHSLASLEGINATGSVLVAECYDYIYESIKPTVRLSSVSGGTDICGCFVMGSPTLPIYRGEIPCKALGMNADVFDDNGKPVVNERGELVCTNSFPSMPVGFWGDDGTKYKSAYFDRFENIWCHGDFAEIKPHDLADGMVIHGRSDTILNPGGVRIGTAEIYRETDRIAEIVEACVIAQTWDDDVRIVLFVILKDGTALDEDLTKKIKASIRKNSTPRHVPAKIIQVTDIPRTTTGKIVEVAVRDTVHGTGVKNKDSLANPESLEQFANLAELAD